MAQCRVAIGGLGRFFRLFTGLLLITEWSEVRRAAAISHGPEVGTAKGVVCCPQTRWANGPAGGPKCLQSNNAEPMLLNTKSSELIRGIQPADLPC